MRPELLRRHAANPILTALDWPYPVSATFNPGAERLRDGRTVLMVRCEDHRGASHLTRAVSLDGATAWQIDPRPTFTAQEDTPEERYGVEDPRLTWVEERGAYAMVYASYGDAGPGVSLAWTTDFVSFERWGRVLPPDDKDAALFPRRIGGRWAMIHRPVRSDGAYVWVSYSTDLREWGHAEPMMRAGGHGRWDGGKLGLSTPPVETPEGWLILYHAVRVTAGGSLYRVGGALLDLDDPSRVVARGDAWLLGPEAPYERVGDVPNVVFPCGAVAGADGDTLSVYSGGADTCVTLSVGSLREIVGWLRGQGAA